MVLVGGATPQGGGGSLLSLAAANIITLCLRTLTLCCYKENDTSEETVVLALRRNLRVEDLVDFWRWGSIPC